MASSLFSTPSTAPRAYSPRSHSISRSFVGGLTSWPFRSKLFFLRNASSSRFPARDFLVRSVSSEPKNELKNDDPVTLPGTGSSPLRGFINFCFLPDGDRGIVFLLQMPTSLRLISSISGNNFVVKPLLSQSNVCRRSLLRIQVTMLSFEHNSLRIKASENKFQLLYDLLTVIMTTTFVMFCFFLTLIF